MQQAPLHYALAPWTFRIIGVNIAVYALLSLDGSNTWFLQGTLNVAAVLGGEWWRLLSSAFLHANVMHLLFNCIGLLIFGSTLERLCGAKVFLPVYVLGAVAANLVVVAYKLIQGQHYFATGSSGAVMAVIGATAIIAYSMWRKQRDRHWVVLFQRMAIIIGLQLLLDLFIPTNSMLTHIAGVVSGLGLGAASLFWMQHRRD